MNGKKDRRKRGTEIFNFIQAFIKRQIGRKRFNPSPSSPVFGCSEDKFVRRKFEETGIGQNVYWGMGTTLMKIEGRWERGKRSKNEVKDPETGGNPIKEILSLKE